MITWDAFNKEFSTLLSSLEVRRKRYLKFLYIRTAIAIAVVFVSFAYPTEILGGILDLFDALGRQTGLFHMKETVEMEAVVGKSAIFSLILLAFICSGFLILMPVYNYRGTNRSAALQTFRFHRFSLKDEAYSKLLKLFGSFEFAPRGGISLVETRNSTLFPEHQLYLPEDFVVGRLNDITVKFCEANIARVEDRERISIFKGLLIVCDISEIKVKLRGNFSGRTALIYDPKKEVGKVADKYHSMERLSLPEKFEPVLEGYTTDVAEAQSIITNELLECLDAFATQTQQLTQQIGHWDDRLAYAVAETYNYIKDKLLSVVGKPMLPSEIAYDEEYKTNLDITKSDQVSDDMASLNQHFELEFYDDKFVVTIPCKFDLFETNSIFEPALNNEDARLVYHMMATLDQLTKHLNHAKL